MTNNDARREEIPLDFLPEDTAWLAQVYTDDPTMDTATKVRCESYAVTPSTVMKFNLEPKGGAAVRLTPITDKKEIKKHKKYK